MHHRLRGGLFPLADKKQTPLASLQSLRTAIGIDSHDSSLSGTWIRAIYEGIFWTPDAPRLFKTGG